VKLTAEHTVTALSQAFVVVTLRSHQVRILNTAVDEPQNTRQFFCRVRTSRSLSKFSSASLL